MILTTYLTERRNVRGENLIFAGKHHPAYDFLSELVKGCSEDDDTPIMLKAECIYGISGLVLRSHLCVQSGG